MNDEESTFLGIMNNEGRRKGGAAAELNERAAVAASRAVVAGATEREIATIYYTEVARGGGHVIAAERFVLSVKPKCLERMIFFSEKSLRRAVSEYVDHYHRERNHQGLENQLIETEAHSGGQIGKVRCRDRPRGMLRYCYREAA